MRPQHHSAATGVFLVTENELRRRLAAAGCRNIDAIILMASQQGSHVMVGGKPLRLARRSGEANAPADQPSCWHG